MRTPTTVYELEHVYIVYDLDQLTCSVYTKGVSTDFLDSVWRYDPEGAIIAKSRADALNTRLSRINSL